MGYISELNGDRESADYYYAKAREANRSSARVALATRKNLQGMKLASVADENEQSVQDAQEKQLAAIRATGAPPLPLRTRDQAVVREPATPPKPEPESPVRIVAEDNPPPEHPAAMAARALASQSQPDALSWTVHLRPIATSDRRSHGQASGTAGNALRFLSFRTKHQHPTDSGLRRRAHLQGFVLTFSNEKASGDMDDSRF